MQASLEMMSLKRVERGNRLRISAATARLIGYAGPQAALIARSSHQNRMTNEAN
jgi:hypothetical protein